MATHKHIPTPLCDNPNEQRIQITHGGPVPCDPVPYDPVPYKWICSLSLYFGGDPLGGTGFLINIPGSSKCVILTAAHNLYTAPKPKDEESNSATNYDDFVEKVIVQFPGGIEHEITDRDCFRVPKSFIENGEHDYGIIILPGLKDEKQSCGFGFAAIMSDRELLNADLSLFGYPLEKISEMWGSGGRFQSVDSDTLRYVVQTTAGQSGSPVFVWYHGFWTVVGIHVRFQKMGNLTINCATRLNASVIRFIIRQINYQYGDISLNDKQDGSGRVLSISRAPEDHGNYGKLVVKGLPDSQTKVYLVPVRTYPEGSAVLYSSNQWVIASDKFKRTYICIDKDAIKKNKGNKGESVGTCSHLSSAPILRRACELVTLSKHDGDPNSNELGIRSVRFGEEVDMTVQTNGLKVDVSKLYAIRKVAKKVDISKEAGGKAEISKK